MAKIEPRFSETRTIHPFAMSQKALATVKFRMSADQDFRDVKAWADERVEATPELLHSDAFAPVFQLVVNQEQLKTESSQAPAELVLSVVLQDDAAWESTCLAAWPVVATPEQYVVDANVLKNICGQRGVTFSVIVSPVTTGKAAAGVGDVIARADFDIPSPSDGTEFPIQVLKSEDFEKRGLSPDTAWVVDWKVHEGFDDVPVADALVVLIHEDVDARLASATNSTAGKLIWQSIACEILSEAALKYFAAAPSEAPSAKTLGGMITNAIQSGSKKSTSDLIGEAKLPSASGRFRSYAQAALGLKKEIAGLKLKGMFS